MDLERAKEYLERACSERLLSACANLANLHMWNVAPAPRDTDLAFELNKKTCALGSAQGCYHTGFIHAFWKDDRDTAEPFFKAACAGGSSFSCRILRSQQLRFHGTFGETREILEQAVAACEDGDLAECNRVLDPTFQRSYEISPARRERAKAAIERVCIERPGERGCGLYLARAFEKTGSLSPVDEAQKQSCDEGNFTACMLFGQTLSVDRGRDETPVQKAARLEAAKAPLAKACDEGNRAIACFALSENYESQKGKVGSRQKRLEYLGKACRNHYGRACFELGKEHYDLEDTSQAAAALDNFKKGCLYGWGTSCQYVSAILTRQYFSEELDLTWKEAVKTAYEYAEVGCHRYRNPNSCAGVGTLLAADEPNGIERDLEKGLSYLQVACRRDVRWACQYLLTKGSKDGEEILKLMLSEQHLAPKSYRFMKEEQALDEFEVAATRGVDVFEHLDESVERCFDDKRTCHNNKVRFNKLIKAALTDFATRCTKEQDGEACGYVARMVDISIGSVKHEVGLIQEYARLGCAYDNGYSCSLIAFRGHFEDWGEVFDRDEVFEAAKKTFEIYSEHAWTGTSLAAIAFDQGRAWSTIQPLYLEHCEAKGISNYACEVHTRRIIFNAARHNPEVAIDFTKRQCEQYKDSRSCALYARALFAKDAALTTEFIPRDCDLKKDPRALCAERGWQLLQREETQEEGARALREACDEDDANACHDLAVWLRGKDSIAALAEGREVLDRSCELGHPAGCFAMGMMYRAGTRYIKADAKVARGYFNKGCEKYHRTSCLAKHGHL